MVQYDIYLPEYTSPHHESQIRQELMEFFGEHLDLSFSCLSCLIGIETNYNITILRVIGEQCDDEMREFKKSWRAILNQQDLFITKSEINKI